MKIKTSYLLGVATVSLGLLSSPIVSAADSQQLDAVKTSLSSVPALELPAKAASIVANASNKDREAVTKNVIAAVAVVNPSALPASVGAIARSTPSMASLAAATAASLDHKQVAAITRAAVGGAPSQVGAIVAAICHVVPNQYNVVAITASRVVPTAGKEILAAVDTAIPSLTPYVTKATSTVSDTTGNVPMVKLMDTVDMMTKSTTQVASVGAGSTANSGGSISPVAMPPSQGGAFHPIGNTPPTTITVGDTVGEPPPRGGYTNP